MKNLKKFVALTACMLLCVMFFTACGGTSEYVGTWEATKASGKGTDGETVEMDASDIYKNFTLILKAGGKATVNLNGDSSDGTWKEIDNGIMVDNELSLTNEGGKLVVEQDGVKVYFEKQ